MKGLQIKMATMVLIAILVTLIVPVSVFAIGTNVQVVEAEEIYNVYIQDLVDKTFQFAISDKNSLDSNSMELNYISATEDKDGNHVAIIEKTKATGKYLYIKEGENSSILEIDYSKAFAKTTMEQVEKTTNRIATEIVTDIVERNEVVDGVTYTETVGGLKITDDENSKYEYVISSKLPTDKYSELKELTDKLSNEYATKDMYSKIEFAKEYNEILENLLEETTIQGIWKPVEDMQIKQPIEAQMGDQYVVLLKKIAQDGTTTYDVKIMTSHRNDEEEKIPGSTQTKIIKETAKLPITGESIAIFVALTFIIIALIVLFVRMKTLQKNGKH